MILSRNLLNKINPKFATLSNEELQVGLNSIGVEVESIIDHSNLKKGLKLAKLINIEKHTNSDHLNICKIEVDKKTIQVVCGAKNLVKNKYVVYAPIGYELPDGNIIAQRNIRGVDSYGMLCGYSELCLDKKEFLSKFDLDSIIMISLNAKVNEHNLYDYLGLNDVCFDLSIPSNRNELNGIYFLAYELNSYFNFKTKLLRDIEINEIKQNDLKIEINSSNVNAYGLIKFTLNKPYDKYDWTIKKYLINANIHVTNTIADIGNFITLMYATPVHMFDGWTVKNKIIVDELKNELTCECLDNKEHTFTSQILFTKDSLNQPIAFIGLMGSKKCSINENSCEVYLEIANIKTDYFVKTTKNILIDSWSKKLFSKHLNVNVCAIALFNTIKHILPSFKNIINIQCYRHITLINSVKINYTLEEVNNFLGTKLTYNQFNKILSRTGFIVDKKTVIAPFYRSDILNVYDICEELLKSMDINKFDIEPINFHILSFNNNLKYDFIKSVAQYFVNCNFIETKTYNLTNLTNLSLFNIFNIEHQISISNPISIDKKYLRHNLVNEMLNILEYNFNHQQKMSNIFEIQNIHFSNSESHQILSSLIYAPVFNNVINQNIINNDFYNVYNLTIGLFKYLNINNLNIINEKSRSNQLYDENNYNIYINNDFIGSISQIKTSVLNTQYKIMSSNVYLINLNLDKLYSQFNLNSKYTITSAYELNPIYKEITFTNPSNLNINNIINKLYEDKYIDNVSLINIYTKDELKSYTIQLTIQPMNVQLSQNEILKCIENAISILELNNLCVKKEQ